METLEMENENKEKTVTSAKSSVSKAEAGEKKSGSKTPLIIAAVCLVIAGLIWLFVVLDTETTGKIRDTMLVIYVLESIVSVTALVVLIVQIARLVNFLKYEIDPILKNTDKTIKKFSGTVSFLCDNAVEPTVNAASTISGIKNAASGVLSIFKK